MGKKKILECEVDGCYNTNEDGMEFHKVDDGMGGHQLQCDECFEKEDMTDVMYCNSTAEEIEEELMDLMNKY